MIRILFSLVRFTTGLGIFDFLTHKIHWNLLMVTGPPHGSPAVQVAPKCSTQLALRLWSFGPFDPDCSGGFCPSIWRPLDENSECQFCLASMDAKLRFRKPLWSHKLVRKKNLLWMFYVYSSDQTIHPNFWIWPRISIAFHGVVTTCYHQADWVTQCWCKPLKAEVSQWPVTSWEDALWIRGFYIKRWGFPKMGVPQ